jgi:nucleolar pre-ribosomal-associated protein 1
MRQWASTAEIQGNEHVRSVSSLDPETMFKTCINFPQWRNVDDSQSSSEAKDDSMLYDPVFIILFLGMIVTEDSTKLAGQDWVEIFRSNTPCLLLSCLSSRRDALRALGWAVFGGVLQSLKVLSLWPSVTVINRTLGGGFPRKGADRLRVGYDLPFICPSQL